MCNRARFRGEPQTLFGSTGQLFGERPCENTFNPQELRPRSRNYVIREHDGARGWDVMSWDVLGGQAAWPMTNVRNLKLPQWRKLAERSENRCLIPLTEFCEWAPDVAPIHSKAMILILAPQDQDRWLRGSYDEIVALQKPYPAAPMTIRGPVFPTRREGDA